jgi:hypothetical protein
MFTFSYVHKTDATNEYHQHRQNADNSCFHRSAFYAGVRTFYSLPRSLTSLRIEQAQFKVALRRIFMCKDYS